MSEYYKSAAGKGAVSFPTAPYLIMNYLSCCGVKEIANVSGTLTAAGDHQKGCKQIVDILAQMIGKGHLKCAFLMFSGVNNTGYGPTLKKFIETAKLGEVHADCLHVGGRSQGNGGAVDEVVVFAY